MQTLSMRILWLHPQHSAPNKITPVRLYHYMCQLLLLELELAHEGNMSKFVFTRRLLTCQQILEPFADFHDLQDANREWLQIEVLFH